MVPPASRLAQVLLFARAPRLRGVKTRLAADVGDQRALEVYRALGSRVVRQIAPVSSITVWYDPPDGGDEIRSWLGEFTYLPQPRGDLGARLAFAFAEHFSRMPTEPAIAIGTDAPGVDADVISRALRALRSAEVVIGPASDGGYYLIGLTRHRPELFHDVPWGTEGVFRATTAGCAAIGVVPDILPELRDVDRVEDLTALGLQLP